MGKLKVKLKPFKILVWTLGISILGYFTYISFLIISPDINDYLNRTDFNSEEWINWEETESTMFLRWNMIHDLTANHELIGLTSKEIKEILGQPNTETDNTISYYLGLTGNYIDIGTLTFKLKDGKVDSYHISEG